jgi:hypothetical protein
MKLMRIRAAVIAKAQIVFRFSSLTRLPSFLDFPQQHTAPENLIIRFQEFLSPHREEIKKSRVWRAKSIPPMRA